MEGGSRRWETNINMVNGCIWRNGMKPLYFGSSSKAHLLVSFNDVIVLLNENYERPKEAFTFKLKQKTED